MIARIVNFIRTGIWRIRLQGLSPAKSFFIRLLRIVLLALRGFREDNCNLRASALTFYSLLSTVPVLAMAFGIAKGFGFEKLLRRQILEKFSAQQEVASHLVDFAHSLLESAKGEVIAGIGIAVLFWTVIRVLSSIEESFNDIWGIKRARSVTRKFSDYLSIALICPILLIMSSSATVFIAGRIGIAAQRITLLGPAASILLKFMPYLLTWVLFTFIYIFMPNTKVRLRSGIVAAIIAGTLFQILHLIYIKSQIGIVRYGTIYGSFAALPLFLVWLQISWLTVLFGAEVSFAHQNVETYEFEPDCLRVSHSFKKLLSLLITNLLVKNFCGGEKPLTTGRVSQTLEIPVRLVRQILYELVESGILSESIEEETNEPIYQPARAVETLTIKYVVDTLEHRGSREIPVAQSEELRKLTASLDAFGELIKESPANIPLRDL